MANLMTSMYTGVSGLNVSQNALNTTAHNLTNVDTKGYVRQQVVIKDWGYQSLGQAAHYTNNVGLGTVTEVVRQVRDRFFDKRYRTEVGREGYYDAQYKTVMEVEDIFGELEGVSFQNSMNDMWKSLQELAKEPDSIVTRTTFVKNSESFLERAETVANQLQSYQLNLNTQIKDKVTRINELGTKIRDLNVSIRQYEASGQERANDLRDERNSALDELGGLIDITYNEDSVGLVNVSAEGVPFVNDTMVFGMDVAKISATSEMLKPVWKSSGVDVIDLSRLPTASTETDIGSLKGILVARGSDVSNYLDVPVRENYASEDAYLLDAKKYNIEIDSSVVRTVQAQFDQLIHGMVTALNEVFAPNTGAQLTAAVTLPDGTTLNAGDKIVVLDKEKAPVGMDANQTMGETVFNRKGMDRYQQVNTTVYVLDENGNTIPDAADPTGFRTQTGTIYVYNQETAANNYSLFTLGEIEINKNILANYSVLPLSDNAKTGEFDADAVNKLLNVWNTPFATLGPNNSTKSNFTNYYNSFIADMSNRGNTLKEITQNQEFAVNSVDTDRQNIISVSSDEELTNLIRFQHAYNASARYVNVIDQMLEHLITRL